LQHFAGREEICSKFPAAGIQASSRKFIRTCIGVVIVKKRAWEEYQRISEAEDFLRISTDEAGQWRNQASIAVEQRGKSSSIKAMKQRNQVSIFKNNYLYI
jgi:hypothetical protein